MLREPFRSNFRNSIIPRCMSSSAPQSSMTQKTLISEFWLTWLTYYINSSLNSISSLRRITIWIRKITSWKEFTNCIFFSQRLFTFILLVDVPYRTSNLILWSRRQVSPQLSSYIAEITMIHLVPVLTHESVDEWNTVKSIPSESHSLECHYWPSTPV